MCSYIGYHLNVVKLTLCARPNDQKLFYWLLLNYRERTLENYDTDITYSASDYHHLRPTNWKKKVTTAEFPSRFGRTPSRFTVISTVPTDESLERVDTVTDSGATVVSYDPYNSSRAAETIYASHAKIVVHRNGSTAKNSSRSNSRRARSDSFHSTSTHSKQARGGRRITASAALRTSRQSLSSIQSSEGTPYTRPATRRKRGVNFSHARRHSRGYDEAARVPASVAGDSAYDCDYLSPVSSVRRAQLSRSLNGRSRAGTQSLANIPQVLQDNGAWNDEVRQFSHSIAKDCDNAFNSSLLSPESYLGDTTNESSMLADTTSLIVSTPTHVHDGNKTGGCIANPWDRRPLPPTPASTASARHELMMAKKRAEQREGNPSGTSARVASINRIALRNNATVEDERNHRTVSAPIYSQYSTQWGKDKIPLPSIHEGSREEGRGEGDGEKPRVVSAPAGYGYANPAQMEDYAGLEFLARQENTIRLVTPSSAKPYVETDISRPLVKPKQMLRGITAYPQSKQELDLRQRYLHDEVGCSSLDGQNRSSEDITSSTLAKKKSLWFKRGSKDKDDVLNSKTASTSSRTDHLTCTSTNSSGGPAYPPAKKKSFNLAFWRNSKDETPMQLSLAGKWTCLVRGNSRY